MRIYKITTRHSQLVDVSTPHLSADLSGVGNQQTTILPINYSEIIQGTWTIILNNAYYLAGYIGNTSSPANGDEIHYKVYIAKGTHTIILGYREYTDAGILEVYLDDTLLDTIDMYNSDTSNILTVHRIENVNVTSDGLKTLKLKINGKNADSSNYIVRLMYIALMRTA